MDNTQRSESVMTECLESVRLEALGWNCFVFLFYNLIPSMLITSSLSYFL